MRARLNLVIVILWLLIPASALAQEQIALKTVDVQFWPEYDQPSMLVIYDFTVADQVSLPAEVVLRIPKGANLIAVAANTPEGGLVNASFDGPTVSGAWQTVVVQVETAAAYHLEYYEPLIRAGAARQFDYLWPGDYAVDDFSVYLRASVDTSSVITEPPLKPAQAGGDILAYESAIGALPTGRQFNLHIDYEKSSETLASPSQGIQPSAPVDQSTSGRVMLSNYLPYVLGGLGLALIIGGSLYFWRPGGRGGGRERRHRAARRDAEAESEIYCHQCGTRARAGDRFCRVCGSRLRNEG